MKRIVVGITGASGILYAKRLLDALSGKAEIHIIISDAAKKVAAYENIELAGYPAVYEDNSRLEADIASGSFLYDAMVIVPCSMKTLSAVANGYA
ncbi:MAG TPA: aromatic acid decarboxylase, partial [Methanocorpusculum sp.]|nr:aromatic acid decarboxylase [Methanocorpusculum sp.]